MRFIASHCTPHSALLTCPLLPRIIVHIYRMLAVVGDAGFTLKDIVRDHGAVDPFPEFDLRFVLLKLAAAHQNRAAGDLQRVAALILPVPLHKRAVAESDRAFAGNFSDLIAGPPESAVRKPDRSGVVGFDADHSRIGAMEGDELAVRN